MQPASLPVAADVVDSGVRYVFRSGTPARSVQYELAQWLYYFGFGKK